MNLNISLPENL